MRAAIDRRGETDTAKIPSGRGDAAAVAARNEAAVGGDIHHAEIAKDDGPDHRGEMIAESADDLRSIGVMTIAAFANTRIGKIDMSVALHQKSQKLTARKNSKCSGCLEPESLPHKYSKATI